MSELNLHVNSASNWQIKPFDSTTF